MSDPDPQPYFMRLCDTCDNLNITVGVRVVEQANKANNYRPILGIIVWRNKSVIHYIRQSFYNTPKFDNVAQAMIGELAKRGYADESPDDN